MGNSFDSGVDKILYPTNSAVLSDRQWAESQAQKQMDFQERMSSTSYQRAVEDLKNAGLNPALAYMQGGASTSSGATAHTSSTDLDYEKFSKNLGWKKFTYIIDKILPWATAD